MIELLEREVQKHGDKAKIMSIKCLDKLKADIDDLKENDVHNDFTKEIVNYWYDFSLPELDFEICSIIIVASKSPIVKAIFNYNNKRIPVTIPPSYVDMSTKHFDIEKYLNESLDSAGYHVKLTPCIPQKMLAVRSGLCSYGRNNITYTDGFGSFFRIATFYSDIPCSEENWNALCQMDSCKTCKVCMNSCPTKAISEEFYQIKANRCLTHFNECEGDGFPDWIDPSAHNCIVGCFKCQESCPKNRPFVNNVIEPVEFSEKETLILLNGEPLESLSKELTEKIKAIDMLGYFNVLPRNLKVLLVNAD